MRTTLTIEPDVLSAAKALAEAERTTIGTIVSRLARQGLSARSVSSSEPSGSFLGLEPLPRRGVVVTNEIVNNIRDDEGV